MTTEGSYVISVIFHNLMGYHSHLIMQYVTREYAPNSIDVISTSSEKFLSFQIGNLRFLDSLQFLTASLDTLFKSLAADGRDEFSRTSLHYPDSDLVFANGNYPYEYMDGRANFLSSTPSTAHFPKKLSLRMSTRELRNCGENSTFITISRPLYRSRRPSASRCFSKF